MNGDVEDKMAISELVNIYAQRVDHKDIDGVAALFTADGEMVVYREPGSDEPLRVTGRDAVREGLSDLHRYRATFHAVGSHTVDLRGDSATAETGCVAHHVTGEKGEERDRVWYLRYIDTLRKQDGQWRFARRELRVEIVTRGPLVVA
jgi:uncharacterized protein (TIGR02246 family)